jgi:hypothetical protein
LTSFKASRFASELNDQAHTAHARAAGDRVLEKKLHQLDIRSEHHRGNSDPALPQPLFLILDALFMMLLGRYLL